MAPLAPRTGSVNGIVIFQARGVNELGDSRVDPRFLGEPPQFGTLAGHIRDLVLLGQAVCQDGDLLPVEEIKKPILDVGLLGAQFINPIPQIASRWSPDLVPELGEQQLFQT